MFLLFWLAKGMSFSSLNIGSQQVVGLKKIKRISNRGKEWASNAGRCAPKTPEYTPRKWKKTRGKRWNSHNFQSINWTVNVRKQAFTWIHRNSVSQKIQENSCERWKTRCFPKVHRTVNSGKASVFLHSRAFAVRENARKLLWTQEHTIISVRLPNGERWKICVFLNSLEFTFLG